MAILEVKTFPDPVLKQVAQKVKKITPELVELAANMLETMYAAPGVGLAAPQVGKSIRLIVIDTRLKDDDGNWDLSRLTDLEAQVKYPLKIFNPEIVEKKGSTTFEEGCLSVPGFSENVKRAEYVVVEGLNDKGEKIRIESDGLLAICLQHEIDHLEGKLFIDRLSTVKRTLIKTKIKKNGYPAKDTEKQHLL